MIHRLICFALALLSTPFLQARPVTIPPEIDRVALKNTARKVIASAVEKFVEGQKTDTIKTFALFPVRQDIDDSFYAETYREAFTQAATKEGLELITGASSPEFARLLEEFAANQAADNVIDEKTQQQLGKLIAGQALLMPRIDLDPSPDGTYALKASIKVTYMKTGQVRSYGSEFVRIPGAMSSDDMKRWALWIGAAFVGLWLVRRFFVALNRARRPR
jgi:hypothetical protein